MLSSHSRQDACLYIGTETNRQTQNCDTEIPSIIHNIKTSTLNNVQKKKLKTMEVSFYTSEEK